MCLDEFAGLKRMEAIVATQRCARSRCLYGVKLVCSYCYSSLEQAQARLVQRRLASESFADSQLRPEFCEVTNKRQDATSRSEHVSKMIFGYRADPRDEVRQRNHRRINNLQHRVHGDFIVQLGRDISEHGMNPPGGFQV